MKITNEQLQQIIKEELELLILEQDKNSKKSGFLSKLGRGLRNIFRGGGETSGINPTDVGQRIAASTKTGIQDKIKNDYNSLSNQPTQTQTHTQPIISPSVSQPSSTESPGAAFVSNFKANYDQLENNIKDILTNAGAPPNEVSAFIADLSSQLKTDLEARKNIIAQADAPLTLAEQQQHLVNVSDLISKHIKALNLTRIRNILKQVQSFVSANEKFKSEINPSAVSVDIGLGSPQSSAAEQSKKSSQSSNPISSTGLPSTPVTSGTTPSVAASFTSATPSPEEPVKTSTIQPQAQQLKQKQSNAPPSTPPQILNPTGARMAAVEPIQGLDPLSPPAKRKDKLKESKENYQKIYNKWQKFTKG